MGTSPRFSDTILVDVASTIPDDAELVIATVTGVTSRYTDQAIKLHGWANISPDADASQCALTIRVGTITGTIVGAAAIDLPATTQLLALECDGVHDATEVANQTYVLTATMTGASSTSTVESCAVTARVD